jgi:hypothetical protein
MFDRWAFGLDLGQSSDYSALAIVREIMPTTEQPEPRYEMPFLFRWDLGTPYPRVVKEGIDYVRRTARQMPRADRALVVDATGVGWPVVEMFAQQQDSTPAELVGVKITSGSEARYEINPQGFQQWFVPKRELVSTMQILLQSQRLAIAKRLPHAPVLVEELKNFQVKITTAANATYEAWREGDHDDMVLATALACHALMYGPLGQPFAAAVGGVVPQAEIR